jgi:ferredoxin/flavodoxin---NADP+ reductase
LLSAVVRLLHVQCVMTEARRVPIERRLDWAEDLMTLVLAERVDDFKPGQFVRVDVGRNDRFAGKPYSIASAPGAHLEILLNKVSGGELTPALFDLRAGDIVQLGNAIAGHFTLDEVPPAETGWLIATGTGIAPYMSMIRSGVAWERFRRVILVHGARDGRHFAYREELEALERARGKDQFSYLRFLSSDPTSGRITNAFRDGRLEETAAASIAPDRAHVLLCGNPEMIAEMRMLLESRRLRKNKRRDPGQITTEPFW